LSLKKIAEEISGGTVECETVDDLALSSFMPKARESFKILPLTHGQLFKTKHRVISMGREIDCFHYMYTPIYSYTMYAYAAAATTNCQRLTPLMLIMS
jgi:hypothetical protein